MLREKYVTSFFNNEPEKIEDKNVDNFMDDLNKLFKKYNLSIAHEEYGQFLIEEYNDDNIECLNAASTNFKKG